MKDESDVKNQDSMAEWRLDTVFDYHQRTMHHLDRYARALGYLDWDTQPDPFRRFEGSRLIPLKQTLPVSDPAYDTVFGPEVIKTQPVNHTTLSQLFYYSLALSAWKAVGPSRWSLRVNPSSGNLHPTEGYLIVGPIGDLTDAGGVFHYAPYPHAFEERFKFSGKLWDLVSSDLPDGTFLVGLASIYWRESWKYGERAFRYCQHDVGHAVAAITIAARMQGWRTILLERPTDASIACLLGIDRQFGFEAEHADCLLAILPCATTGDDSFSHDWDIPQEVLESLAATNPTGVPNQLSQDYHEWEVIETVSEVSAKFKPPNEDF